MQALIKSLTPNNHNKETLTPPLEKFHLFNLQALHVLHGKHNKESLTPP